MNQLMSERQVKEAMAQSGKWKVSDLLGYMESRYKGKYDKKQAKIWAKEILS